MVYEFRMPKLLDESETVQLVDDIMSRQGHLMLVHSCRKKVTSTNCSGYFHRIESGIIDGEPKILERPTDDLPILKYSGANVIVPVRNKVNFHRNKLPDVEFWGPVEFMTLYRRDLTVEQSGEISLLRGLYLFDDFGRMDIYLSDQEITNARIIGSFFERREELPELLRNSEKLEKAMRRVA